MESPHQASKLMGRLLLAGMLLLLGATYITQYTSHMVQKLATRSEENIQIVLRTKPGMLISYTPATLKGHITLEDVPCKTKKTNCSSTSVLKFFTPRETRYTQFWDNFKQGLSSWRYNPLLVAQLAWSYLTAWHERRTNLSPAEFTLLALEMMKLEPSDFTIKLPPPPKKRGKFKETPAPTGVPDIPDKAPLAVQDRPLILEIFNASGKKGIAQELTQYLRAQNEKGLLRVDVFQYENYPSIEENSWLEDYSGRLADVKKLGHTLGINSEIRAGATPNVMCDTRIIIGKDFALPL